MEPEETSPEFTGQTAHGELSLPDTYKGEWFVLFSHPGDFTPVCTTEFVAFQQRSDEFEEFGDELSDEIDAGNVEISSLSRDPRICANQHFHI